MPAGTGPILVVDDEPTQLRLLSAMIARAGHKVETAADGAAALARLLEENAPPISCMVLDLQMPEMNGIEVLEALRPEHPDLPVIVLTAHSSVSRVVEAMKAGASDFIVKPASAERLRTAIDSAMANVAMTGELAPLRRAMPERAGFEDLVGSSPAMAQTVTLARKAARTSIPVLIEGASGVGKEMFARAIHRASDRADAPFVAVNCGAIPENLVESLLFGHEKGAFTGAAERHAGKFQEASGGTLFLDEVSELPLDIQVKLLRALQEGEIDPVGARQPVPVDIRLISATNRDMARLVAEGGVREDLYYRLNVFPLYIPALRERRDDISVLADHFIETLTKAENLPPRRLSTAALDLLTSYDWPGNIRQLQNAVFRAVVMCEGEELEPADFPQITGGVSSLGEEGAPGPSRQLEADNAATRDLTVSLLGPDGHVRLLNELEYEIIEKTIARYSGHLSEVARRLGIGRSTLYRKLQASGLSERVRRARH